MISRLNIDDQNITLIGDPNINHGSCSDSYKSNLLKKFITDDTNDIFIEQSFISKEQEVRSELNQSFMINSINSPFNCYDINSIIQKYPKLKIHYCDIRWFNNNYHYKNLFNIWFHYLKNKKINIQNIPTLEELFKATKIDKQLNKSKYKKEIEDYYIYTLENLLTNFKPENSNIIINMLMDIYIIARATKYDSSNIIIITSLDHMKEINKFFDTFLYLFNN